MEEEEEEEDGRDTCVGMAGMSWKRIQLRYIVYV